MIKIKICVTHDLYSPSPVTYCHTFSYLLPPSGAWRILWTAPKLVLVQPCVRRFCDFVFLLISSLSTVIKMRSVSCILASRMKTGDVAAVEILLCNHLAGRFFTKCTESEQRGRHLLHSDRWPRSRHARITSWVPFKVLHTIPSTEGQNHLLVHMALRRIYKL